jgi:ATP-binding cassette, subfamily F, member 3
VAMETRMRELELVLATDPEAMDAYGDLMEKFEAAGGYDYPVRIDQTLSGLGFSKEDYNTPLTLLSGGQKTRALLARLLLEMPDLLILDEPTNHLDQEAVTWLETMLRHWEGTLLIVSHDRYFLDVVVDVIWEMTPKGIDNYKGNYSAYLRQREERREYQAKLFEQEKSRLDQEMEYIRKNIARPSTNDIAVGKLRRLSRDIAAIQEMGVVAYAQKKNWSELGIGNAGHLKVAEAEKALKSMKPPVFRQPRLNLTMRTPTSSGTEVLRTEGLSIGYSDAPKALFKAENIVLMAGQCAALIGGNGAGKTTFLRTLRGEIQPLTGTMKTGHKVHIGYFAQAHHTLIGENTVLEELMRHKPMSVGDARQTLARYMFRDEDVFKPISALSGGERAKLALGILALEGANLLVLDEPTNHLDIPAQEALQEVLETFEGTILMVTHDRYLVDRLATEIWSVEDGQLSVFSGTYKEFLAAEKATS